MSQSIICTLQSNSLIVRKHLSSVSLHVQTVTIVFDVLRQNTVAQARAKVIGVEIDSRLLIRLNQSASMLPTVGRMTRLSSCNCTYGGSRTFLVCLSSSHRTHVYTRAHTVIRLEPALPTDRLLSICIVH